MKSRILFALFCTLLIEATLLFGGSFTPGSGPDPSSATEPPAAEGGGVLTLGAILPLTGNGSDQGEWCKRGFDLAAEELNGKSAGAVKIIYEDSRGADVASATQAYRSIMTRFKPAAVLTYGSGVGMGLTPLVNADRVIQMGVATGTPKYSSPGDFTFRTFASAALESKFLLRALGDLGARSIAVMNINNDYGVGTANALKAAFTAAGGKVVLENSYNPSDTDFRTLLLKVRSAGADLLYLASYPADGALLLKQSRELGLRLPVLASSAIIGGKEFFSVAGDAADGLLISSAIMDERNSFLKRYSERFPQESPVQSIYAARAYDAVMLLSHAAKSCGNADSVCMRDKLFTIKDWPGASGNLTFDENGDVLMEFGLFEVRGRSFVRRQGKS